MSKFLNKAEPNPQIVPSPQNNLISFSEEDIGKSLKRIKVQELKIVFFGSRDFVIPVIQAIKDHFNLVAIVTVPDQPVGRGYDLTPTPVKSHFLDSGIPILDPKNLDEEFIQIIKDLEPDLFVVAAYGKMIPENVLKLSPLGAINLHPSLLPKYRGPSPIQNAILNGEKETGMSFMLIDQKMDHGSVIFQNRFDISDQDTFISLGTKIFQKASQDIVEVIEHFTKGKLKQRPQDHSKATFTKLIKKEDGYFDINNPPSPEKLDRMIRAYYPWPNAWTVWKAESGKGEGGRIIKFLPEGMVQMEGKKPVKLTDFLNGYPDFPIKQ